MATFPEKERSFEDSIEDSKEILRAIQDGEVDALVVHDKVQILNDVQQVVERRQLMDRLRESEETLQAIREGEIDAIVIADHVYTLKGAEYPYRLIVEEMREGALALSDGTILFGNRRLAEMLALSDHQIVNQPLEPFVLHEDREFFKALLRQGAKTSAQGEVRILTANGDTVPALFLVNPMQVDGLSAVCISISDLTHHKLRHTYQQIAESIPHLVWTALPDGTPDYFNNRWRVYTGIARQGTTTNSWTSVLHPSDRRRFNECWKNAVLQKSECEIECRLKGPKGYEWHLSRVLPALEGGEVVRWFGTFTNIHKQTLLAESLRKSDDALRKSQKELESFAATASHDLKDPLRKIITYLDKLQSNIEAKQGEADREYFFKAQRASKRMMRLIEDLLHFSEATVKPASFEVLDLRTLIAETVSDLELKITDSNGEIIVEDLPRVCGNKFQMRQLFHNLLSNALKYRKPNENPRVCVSGRTLCDGRTEIRVEDNGIGFESRHAQIIFQPFQRLHGKNEFEGSGIGLAICEKIARHHGGVIRAESVPGVGSVFTVTLGG